VSVRFRILKKVSDSVGFGIHHIPQNNNKSIRRVKTLPRPDHFQHLMETSLFKDTSVIKFS